MTRMEEMLVRCESATPCKPLYFQDETGYYSCMAVVFDYDVSYQQFSARASARDQHMLHQQQEAQQLKRISTLTLRREESPCWCSESGVLAVYTPQHVVVFTGYPDDARYDLEQLGFRRKFVHVPGAGISVVPLCGGYLHSPNLA